MSWWTYSSGERVHLAELGNHWRLLQQNRAPACWRALLLYREKSEKRCLNPAAPAPVSSSGVARVPPTSHVGPVQAVRGSHAAGGWGRDFVAGRDFSFYGFSCRKTAGTLGWKLESGDSCSCLGRRGPSGQRLRGGWTRPSPRAGSGPWGRLEGLLPPHQPSSASCPCPSESTPSIKGTANQEVKWCLLSAGV